MLLCIAHLTIQFSSINLSEVSFQHLKLFETVGFFFSKFYQHKPSQVATEQTHLKSVTNRPGYRAAKVKHSENKKKHFLFALIWKKSFTHLLTLKAPSGSPTWVGRDQVLEASLAASWNARTSAGSWNGELS